VIGIRKLICGVLALFLLRTRRARLASERAFSGDVVTSIFFHNPGKRLFERCVSWLIHKGYTLISVEELVEILQKKRPFPRGAAWISLDDGYREWRTNLLPIIRKYRVPVTLFIPSGIVESDGTFPWLRKRTSETTPTRHSLTLDELKEISRYPEVAIGGHTGGHTVTTTCTQDELKVEIGGSKHLLEFWTGKPVCSFAYPEGRYDGRERQTLLEFEYSIAATTQAAFVDKETDPLFVPRFCVPDKVTFAEAICNMVGIWQAFLAPLKEFLGYADARRLLQPPTLAVKSPEPESERQPQKETDKETSTHVV
jgi:poly-beta-1,6-N-acetyl-D-glucosamine N-deacetylase